MNLVVLLHFYQPYNQQKDILDRIVHESYLPLVRGLLANPNYHITVNIAGSLVQLLVENNYTELLDGIKTLLTRGQIELVSSSMYHAFLPLIPHNEVLRQIALNNDYIRQNLYSEFKPKGFFSPEMGISTPLISIVKETGVEWVAAAQAAYPNKTIPSTALYVDKYSGLSVLFRNKRVSSLILSSIVKTSEDLILQTTDIHSDPYWFIVMDAETFGHHRIGLEALLFDILGNSFFTSIVAKDALLLNIPKEEVDVRSSTWTNEEQDFWLDQERTQSTDAKSFILWKDPDNPIHKLQWQFTDYVIETVNKHSLDTSSYLEARTKLDKAIASDHFWWASAKPWWSLEMIEQGAFMLKDVIHTLTDDKTMHNKSEEYYRSILDIAFTWQRSGYIRNKHLQNSGTFMQKPFKDRTHLEWYNQIILEFEDQMNKCAHDRNYEQAIKWRDALYKIKLGTDIFDVLHVVDELWSARSIPGVKPFFEYNYDDFSVFARDHMLGFKTRDEFDTWRMSKTVKYTS